MQHSSALPQIGPYDDAPVLAALPDLPANPPADVTDPAIPAYLEQHYWWAYVRPWAVRVFERPWLVNLILWGWYAPLRDAALAALGPLLPGKTIQIACCYGSLTPMLAERIGRCGGSFDVIDVAPAQLDNLASKLGHGHRARLMRRDSTNLGLPDASYDRALLFFLMHEQPREARARTLAEAFRVVKPGGKIVIVDFGKPAWWHPLRYIWLPVLRVLEPFAPDLWRHEIEEWIPAAHKNGIRVKRSFFGGFYQKIVVQV